MAEEGLLKTLIQGTQLAGIGLTPQMIDKDIVIELSTEQLKTMLLQNADERAKKSVSVELHEGKLLLRIRLW